LQGKVEESEHTTPWSVFVSFNTLLLTFSFLEEMKIHWHWTPLLASWYSKLSSAGAKSRQLSLSHDLSQIGPKGFVYVLKDGTVIKQGFWYDLKAEPEYGHEGEEGEF
jgi:hypothetical protein